MVKEELPIGRGIGARAPDWGAISPQNLFPILGPSMEDACVVPYPEQAAERVEAAPTNAVGGGEARAEGT